MQFRHFLIELLRKEVDIVFVNRDQREDEEIFSGLMLSTFRPSMPSKPAKSTNGKTQLSSGLLEQSGSGKKTSEQSFVKPPPDAVDEIS